MATVLDVGLLQTFDVVFAFLIVFAIFYAMLQKTEIISKSMGINAVVAASAGFLLILSDTIVSMVTFMLPWFVVIIIFLILMLLIFKTFDPKLDTGKALKSPALLWTLVGVCLLLVVVSLASTFGQSALEASQGTTTTVDSDGTTTSGDFEGNIMNIIFHPKVLGIAILFGVAIFAVAFLSGSPN